MDKPYKITVNFELTADQYFELFAGAYGSYRYAVHNNLDSQDGFRQLLHQVKNKAFSEEEKVLIDELEAKLHKTINEFRSQGVFNDIKEKYNLKKNES